MVVASLQGPTEYKVVRRGSPPQIAGSPLVGRASPKDCVRCREQAERGPHGPDPGQRDTVLDTVKDATRRFAVAKAILDSVCARRHWRSAWSGRRNGSAVELRNWTFKRKDRTAMD
jgi:hypothetical protein